MMNIKIDKNIWVQRLTVPCLLLLSLKSRLTDVKIYYDINQTSRFALLLTYLLRSIKFGLNIVPIDFRFGELDENGEPLSYAYLQELNQCSELFIEKYLLGESVWTRKLTQVYLAVNLSQRIKFIQMARHKIFQLKSENNFIVIQSDALFCLIQNYYHGKDLKVMPGSFSILNLKEIARLSYWFFFACLSFFRLPVKAHNIRLVRPSVWIEYEPDLWVKDENGYVLENISNSHFFWRDYYDPKKFEVVFYFDRLDVSVLSESKLVENAGYKWIDFNRPFRLIRLSLKDIRKVFMSLSYLRSIKPFWLASFIADSHIRGIVYTAVYKYFKVKVLIEHQDSVWMPYIQARAIEMAGGIMMGFHWSNHHFYKAAYRAFPQHIFFVWGKIMYENMIKAGNLCRHILPCGIWFSSQPKKNSQLEALIKKASFTLAVFDSSVEYDSITNIRHLEKFYDSVINLIEQNEGFFAVIKSKKYSIASMPITETLRVRMKSLLEQNRIFFLKSYTSPADAFARANAAVCLNINSAGIISAAKGCRAIHWDCCGLKRYFLYNDKTQKIIYSSFDAFNNAIKSAADGNPEVGDFSHWRERFDFFSDDFAPKRVGKFIQDFMERVCINDNIFACLNRAAESYRFDNNVGNDFYANEEIWNKE